MIRKEEKQKTKKRNDSLIKKKMCLLIFVQVFPIEIKLV